MREHYILDIVVSSAPIILYLIDRSILVISTIIILTLNFVGLQFLTYSLDRTLYFRSCGELSSSHTHLREHSISVVSSTPVILYLIDHSILDPVVISTIIILTLDLCGASVPNILT